MIHVLIGTKGQYIKMSPILQELNKRNINYNLVDTSVHKSITGTLIKTFNLQNPDYYIGKRNKDPKNIHEMIGWFLKASIDGIVKKKEIWKGQKGIVLLHGDTASTLLGVVLAKLSGIKIAHVESGYRSHDIFNPFPEEIIRKITAKFADVMFAADDETYNNLKKEKVKGEIINTQGNTLFDSIRYILNHNEYQNFQPPLSDYVLATIHRTENLYNKKRLKIAVKAIQMTSNDHKVYFVLYKSTQTILKKRGYLDELNKNKNIEMRYDYLDYPKFIKLISNSIFTIIDGGIQLETYFLDKPCLSLRKKTEIKDGLGENTCISNFDLNIISDFIKNYKKYRRKKEIDKSCPSKIIVDYLVNSYKTYI